jgi:predicted N-formylglutamate amidohydrolase
LELTNDIRRTSRLQMLGLARKVGSFSSRMASPLPSSKKGLSPRSFMVEAKDYAKKYFLDEDVIVVEESFWKAMPINSKPKTLITCEHSSNRFPQHLSKEHELVDTHWAVDIGAEDVSGMLASNMQLPILSSRISRLVIDVNRPLTSDTLFRHQADGRTVKVNEYLSFEEKQDRIDRYWKPYRAELGTILTETPGLDFVLSIHSFTPNYEGQPREIEIGVLYTDSKLEGSKFLAEFAAKGYKVAENEPWPASLCDILIPVTAAGKDMVILEIRNDLASDPHFRRRITTDIQHILESLHLA